MDSRIHTRFPYWIATSIAAAGLTGAMDCHIHRAGTARPATATATATAAHGLSPIPLGVFGQVMITEPRRGLRSWGRRLLHRPQVAGTGVGQIFCL